MILRASRINQILIAVLPRIQRYMRGSILRRVFSWLCAQWNACEGAVEVRLHGFPMLINGGNPYPLLLCHCRWFNAPLVELCHLLAISLGRPICFVDVGSAVGDTVALIKERCPRSVEKFVCVEGDAEFFSLLAHNMNQFIDVTVVNTMLAREPGAVGSLVKHHRGTASATGTDRVHAVRLDSIEALSSCRVDLLKIDVDGFDGEVLAGASGLLKCSEPPTVIFEWHPKLCKDTGNDPLTAFETLAQCGYKTFAWFDNLGIFSHFSGIFSPDILEDHARYLLSVNGRRDEHFDVIALPPDSSISLTELASLNYAGRWASR